MFPNTKSPLKPDGSKVRWQIPMRAGEPHGNMEYYLVGEIKEKFIELFPTHTNETIMQWFGISYSTMQRLKKRYGLKKNMKRIWKDQAKLRVRKMRESGYLDSIRGRPFSEKALEKIKEMRANGFNPILKLKETNKRKYNATCKKISKSKKNLFRKENLRVKYGLPQKTKLHVSNTPLTRKAHGSKYRLIKFHNYFPAEDDVWVVCYDSQTSRSAKMEATAIKNGLKIEQGED